MNQLSFFGSPGPATAPTPHAHSKPSPDICSLKHGGNENSKKANARAAVVKESLRERVRIFVAGCADRGTTIHEIAKFLGKPVHSVSGRVSELKADDKIFDSGRNRDGCSVLVPDRRWVNGSNQ